MKKFMNTTIAFSKEDHRSPIRGGASDEAELAGSEIGAPFAGQAFQPSGSPCFPVRCSDWATEKAAARLAMPEPADRNVRPTMLASLLLCVLALMPLGLRAATNDLSGALQTGLFEEEANRNLPAAIAAYEKVAKQFDQDRALAATAIFGLGEVNRKLGKTNEAAAFYQRILREFTDQDTLTKLSQQNLAGMNLPPQTPETSMLSRASRAEQAKLLEQQIKLAEQDASDVKKLSEIGRATPSEVRAKLFEVLNLRRQLAAMDVSGENIAAGDTKTPITAVLDEEESEIRRIQAMIQNSPDLINAVAPGDTAPTPLCQAAGKGQLRVAKFLLDNGAQVNAKSAKISTVTGLAGATPLHFAVNGGHRAMTELLLQRGADVEAWSIGGRQALHLAVEKGFQAVAEALLAGKADVNAGGMGQNTTPLHLATVKGHSALTAFLISKGADVNAAERDGCTPLMNAAREGHLEVVKLLLAAKATVDAEDQPGRTALSYAAEKGHAEVVKTLLAAKAEPNAGKVNLPLHCAIKSRSAGIVEALLKAGADANRSGKLTGQLAMYPELIASPLALATMNSSQRGFFPQPDIAKLLLANKADPNGKSVDGKPLIFSAVNDAELVKAFLDAGAKPNVTDGDNPPRTPLFNATDPKVISLLAAAGADLEAKYAEYTPLTYYATSGSKEAVEALLKAGANVNASRPNGFTALHIAANLGNAELVSLLLAHKADVNAREERGYTPLDLALANRRSQQQGGMASPSLPGQPVRGPAEPVIELLRKHGGLADLPKLDRIEVSRASSGHRETVFVSDTNQWNRFTLMELLAKKWGLVSVQRKGAWGVGSGDRINIWDHSPLRFPALDRITIQRTTKDGASRETIAVNLEEAMIKSGSAGDVPLQFGDVVDIPEEDHPVTERWRGIADKDMTIMMNCLARSVSLKVGSLSTNLNLRSSFFPGNTVNDINLTAASFMLRSVLDESKLIRSSSDLTRVKVTRREAGNSKPRVWVLDCSIPDKAPDLWLRDGDVIEVPEK